MQLKYPRLLTKKSFLRFYYQCLRNNKEFKCSKCGRPFKIGDFIFKFRAKHDYYCLDCYQELYQDISDSILDEKDKRFIESGKWD